MHALKVIDPGGGGGGLFTLGVATPMTSSDAGRRPRYSDTNTTPVGTERYFFGKRRKGREAKNTTYIAVVKNAYSCNPTPPLVVTA